MGLVGLPAVSNRERRVQLESLIRCLRIIQWGCNALVSNKGYVTYSLPLGAGAPGSYSADLNPITLGIRFRPLVDIYIIGCRFFRDNSDDGHHLAWLTHPDVDLSYRVTTKFFDNAAGAQGPGAWQNAYFRTRQAAKAGENWSLFVWFQKGRYWVQSGRMASGDVTIGDLIYPQNTATFYNGAYSYAADLRPQVSSGGAMWGIDPIYVRQKP